MVPSSTPPDLVEAKRRLRLEMRRRREALAEAGAGARAAAILLETFLRPGDVVAVFWSIGDELDTAPLRAGLIERGHDIALPVVVGRGQPLALRAWRPGDAMASGPFGIQEPLAAAPALQPTLIVVPFLAVNRRGYRLGYGGGYYDRTIAGLPAARTVGWGYAGQVIDRLPTGPNDQAVDAVVTEAGWFVTEERES
ncbi:MAG: 5-formyltetrahydrofolate cyclo-ligase [Alphaproteobacteria bacterium]